MGILKLLHKVPAFISLAPTFHETTLSKLPFTVTEKTLPNCVPSSYPPDLEKEVPLHLKLLSVMYTSPEFPETIPLGKSEGAGLSSFHQGQTWHIIED